ncbi:MAG: hypothetical protein HOV94_33380 [Saccharothrix sp.]|nr:hypothetical protein [Saccharothrix sp.]
MRRLIFVLPLLAMLFVVPTVGASAGTAGDLTAQACSTTWSPNPDDYAGSWGWAEVSVASAPLRPGPYADCGTRATLQRGWTMTVYCYYNNLHENTWFYVSAYPDWKSGWIYYGNVAFHGVIQEC